MKNISKLITLRSNYKSVKSSNVSTSEYNEIRSIISILNEALKKKNILLCDFDLQSINNLINIKLSCFVCNKKMVKYKKKRAKNKSMKKGKTSIKRLFSKLIKKNTVNIYISVLNKKVNRIILGKLYNKLKFYQNKIFPRRFNSFVDFLKLTSLVEENKLKTSTYVEIVSNTFKYLQKKSHSKFFVFLKLLFLELVQSSLYIQGINFQISGKLKGKLRSSALKITIGKIESSSLKSLGDCGICTSNTIYGSFGVKMFLNYKK